MKKTERMSTIEALKVGESIEFEGSLYFPQYVRQKCEGKFSIFNKGGEKKDGKVVFLWKLTRKE